MGAFLLSFWTSPASWLGSGAQQGREGQKTWSIVQFPSKLIHL